MPLFSRENRPADAGWEPDASIRPLSDEHRLPETAPKPTFTLGLDA